MVTNIGLCTALAYHLRMKLSQYNKFLRSRPEADAALLISAKTSSAVEGIRQPFVQDAKLGTVGDTRACQQKSEHHSRRTTTDDATRRGQLLDLGLSGSVYSNAIVAQHEAESEMN